MNTVTEIAAGGGVSVARVSIRAETPRWSEPEVPPGYRLVFVRRGAFRARVGGHVLLAEPAVAYAGGPGVEQSIAHWVGADDACTAVTLSAALMSGLVPSGRPLGTSVAVTGDVAVAHRLLVAPARQGADSLELAERAVGLVSALLAPSASPATTARRPATRAARMKLAESARELLAADTGMSGLADIARRVGCSPHHLSRVFRAETGVTLSRYRPAPGPPRAGGDRGRGAGPGGARGPARLRRPRSPDPDRAAGIRPCPAGPAAAAGRAELSTDVQAAASWSGRHSYRPTPPHPTGASR